ncbi:MAG: hypothetical protein ABIE70_12185 [bacterium]
MVYLPGRRDTAACNAVGATFEYNATGNNTLVQELFPRIEQGVNYAELSDYVNGGTLRLRLKWSGYMWLNHLPFVQAEI